MGLSSKDKEHIIQFCDKNHIRYKIGYQNFTGSVSLPESFVIDIQTEDQAVALAKFILKLNRKKGIDETITYRAVAAGESRERKEPRYDRKSYSMTPIMEADILLRLRGDQFHDIQVVSEKDHLVNVGPSIQMGDLDSRLYHEFNHVLPTSTLIPWVTLGGCATGTHGTGRDQPSIAGLIQRMRILRPDGNIVSIDKDHPDFETIRGAHLGLFGIVLDMDIQCRPAMKLEVTMKTTNIYHYKELIKQGLYRDNEYVSVAYFADGEHDEGAKDASIDVIIMTWKPVPLSTPDKGNCAQLEYMGQRFTIFLQESLNINALLKKHPQLVPLFKQYIVAPLAVAGQDKTIVVPWPDGAHYQRAFPYDLDDEDDLFPVSDDCHELLDALDFMVATLNKHAKMGLNPALYAMYFRYFKGTNGGLSTSAHGKDQHVVGFDMTSARNMPGFQAFKTEIRNYLMEKYGAKPHHGKTVPTDANYADIYGEGYDHFMRALKAWLKECNLDLNTSPHMNPFFRHHLGISQALAERATEDLASDAATTTGNLSSQALAESLLAVFHQHDGEFRDEPTAKALCERLEMLVIKKMALSGNPATHFHSREEKEVSDSELIEVPEKKRKHCCAIL